MPEQALLITGGAGSIATHFAELVRDEFELALLDLPGAFDDRHARLGRLIEADLSVADQVAPALEGIDAVVHLGGERRPGAPWSTLLPSNIIGTYNMLTSAVAAGTQHVVYASSVHAVTGYPEGTQVRESDPVRPGDLYGVTKCFGEAMGAYIAGTGALSFTALRIGAFQDPERLAAADTGWMLRDFVAIEDLLQLMRAAVHDRGRGFRLYNAVSANRFPRLPIDLARTELDYAPRYDAFDLSTGFQEAIAAVGGLQDPTYDSGIREDVAHARALRKDL